MRQDILNNRSKLLDSNSLLQQRIKDNTLTLLERNASLRNDLKQDNVLLLRQNVSLKKRFMILLYHYRKFMVLLRIYCTKISI